MSDELLLVVDDDEQLRRSLAKILQRAGYEAVLASDAQEAREQLERRQIALVLTDVNMPGESGLDLARDLLASGGDTAVVMVTGLDDTELAVEALELGAYGYVIKPFRPNELTINVANALRRRRLELAAARYQEELEVEVDRRTAALARAMNQLREAKTEVERAHEETIRRLSVAAEYRDDSAGAHIARVSGYVCALARILGLDAARADLLRLAAPLHDIGKIAIPDSVLLKPGPLSPAERQIMERHAEAGYRMLSGASSRLLDLAASIALNHHERWDGQGYPNRLAGADIPVEGRIVAVADVFDALTSDRVYRPAFTVAEAVRMIEDSRGTHFDPKVVDAFVELVPELERIYVDEPPASGPPAWESLAA